MNDAHAADSFSAKRAPDWRWQQTCKDAKSRKIRLPSACGEMRRAAMALAEWYGADAQQREHLRKDARFRDTAAVLEWYNERAKGVQIEALVLARMSSDYIAKQLGLSAEAVDRYITLCFDVRAALDDAPYILRHAVVSERRRGDPATSQRRTVMKLLAYHCGPQVLIDLYGVRATSETWNHPTAHVRREAALAQFDRSVDRLLGAGSGDPPRCDDVEACLVAVEPYLSDSYSATKTEWLLRRSSKNASPIFQGTPNAAPPSPAPSLADLSPRKRVEVASDRLSELRLQEEEEPKAINPSYSKAGIDLRYCVAEGANDLKTAQPKEKLFNDALEVRESFLNLFTTRSPVPPEWLDGPGLSADWNADVIGLNVEVADWAQHQIAERDSQTLVESTLFVQNGAEVRLADAIATPGWPIIVTRDCRDDAPTGFFAGAWMCTSVNPIQRFLFDRYTIAYRSNNHGLVMAAADSNEVAAWRRLGVAAIPLPIEGIWSAAAGTFWNSFAKMCRDSALAKTSGKSVEKIALPPAVLTVCTLDPMTLAAHPNVEWRRSAHTLRSLWDRHCDDRGVCVGLWDPSATTIETMRASIAGQSSVTLASCILGSVENELRFLIPKSKNLQPALTRTSCRQALATMNPEAPLAERDELYRQFLEAHERHVAEPLQTDERSTNSPINCVTTDVIIGLSRRLAEIDADLMLAAPTSNADLRTRSNLRGEYCKTASALTSAIKTAKGGSRASQR